jgi:hypothetical protein
MRPVFDTSSSAIAALGAKALQASAAQGGAAIKAAAQAASQATRMAAGAPPEAVRTSAASAKDLVNDSVATAADTAALLLAAGRLNQQLGFTTAIAAAWEVPFGVPNRWQQSNLVTTRRGTTGDSESPFGLFVGTDPWANDSLGLLYSVQSLGNALIQEAYRRLAAQYPGLPRTMPGSSMAHGWSRFGPGQAPAGYGGFASAPNSGAAFGESLQTARETMAFQLTMGRLNQQQGFVTAIANAWEAQGQAAKGRGEATKQLV